MVSGSVSATVCLFGVSVWHPMAFRGNLPCFLPDASPSCSPPSVNSGVKCQLLSCHCEALQDSLVASGVTDALGMEKDVEFGGTALFWTG